MIDKNTIDIRPNIRCLNAASVQNGECSEEFLILSCIEGSCWIEMESGSYLCERGDIALIPKNEIYQLRPAEEAAWTAGWSLSLAHMTHIQRRGCPAADQIIELSECGAVLRLNAEERERMSLLINGCLLSGSAEDMYANYYRINALELLLIELCRVLENRGDIRETRNRSETERSRLIKNVIAYINEHYQEEIRLDSIARQFWVSPSYLSRQFKSKVGINITRFITERRIQAAQRLLITSDLDISEIADQLGFKSANYFYTVFKKIHGISPREYRKRDRISDKLLNHRSEMEG